MCSLIIIIINVIIIIIVKVMYYIFTCVQLKAHQSQGNVVLLVGGGVRATLFLDTPSKRWRWSF